MSRSPAAASNVICVLVADSNRMQAQLLTSALRRRSEFHIATCRMDTASLLHAVARTPPRVALLSPDASHEHSACMASLRQLHLSNPEVI